MARALGCWVREAETLTVGVAVTVTTTVCLDAEIRAELDRVLGSASFAASERNRRFLVYVVEEAVAGRSERLKAYSIATTVFGRPEGFDPQADPIVRMEARRVRRALERFYLIEGNGQNAVRIDIPKGGYAPEFQRRGPQPPADQAEVLPVTVEAFVEEGDPSHHLNLARGFSRQIAIGLLRRGRPVFCGPQMQHALSEPGPYKTPGGPGQILTGGVAVFGNEFRVTALLFDASTGRVMWGEKFDREIPHEWMILEVRDRLAENLADALHCFLSARFNPEPSQADLPSAQSRLDSKNNRAYAATGLSDADAEAMAGDGCSR